MKIIIGLLLMLALFVPVGANVQSPADALLDKGDTFEVFLASVVAQRARWLANVARADAPPPLVARLRRVGGGLALLIVTEDWCPDSVNTVPYVIRLAELAGVNVRIADRTRSAALLQRYRTSDGRTATPTIILLRDGYDVAAWVERPAPLEAAFMTALASPQAAAAFPGRQAWCNDSDRGRTALEEIVTLAERTAVRNQE